jgi:fructose-bisphosphate aldolase class I
MNNLIKTALKMVESGKGILAADESNPTCTKRFESLSIESTPTSRNAYRDLLFSAPDIEKYISGVILFNETFYQKDLSSQAFYPEFLSRKNILPGIKVDSGLELLDVYTKEQATKGLHDLEKKALQYYIDGARFAKWRAVYHIDESLPSQKSIDRNANDLADYASICQSSNLVPIVEPEVLMNGNHSIAKSYEVTSKVLHSVFKELSKRNIIFEAMILKPNMVLSGYNNNQQASIDEVAKWTVKCLKENVPSDVPGIAFLSGGQSDELATLHLNAMNQLQNPWKLTFSYGRALQSQALQIWAGNQNNILEAQNAFLELAKANSSASQGLL